MSIVDLDAIRDLAARYAEGYAAAVAALRDDERYRNWWSADGAWQHKTTGRYWDGTGRQHLADYLETVGPTRATGELAAAVERVRDSGYPWLTCNRCDGPIHCIEAGDSLPDLLLAANSHRCAAVSTGDVPMEER